jgi:hypothetical protein
VTDHEQFYRDAMRRIYRNLLAISAAGLAVTLAWKGWLAASGFLLGAAASAVNFRWFHSMVDDMGRGPMARSRNRTAWLLGFRYLLFGTVAYVIVKIFRINPAALAVGLLVVVAAVFLEILYELIYARA